MAGTRQHVLPKFLMKGFASRTDGEKVFCWLYQRTSGAREVNTRHIGVENSFYESDGGLTADDRITEVEGAFADLVAALRNHTARTPTSDPRIADFVSHLTWRSKSIRMGFQDAVNTVVDHLDEHFDAPSNVFRLALMYPDLIEEEIAKGLDSLNLRMEQRAEAEKCLRQMLPALLQQLSENPDPAFKVFLTEVFQEFRKVVPGVVRKSQVETLMKDVFPTPRVEAYRRLAWWVIDTSEVLILGDIGVLFEVDGPRSHKFIDDKDDHLRRIYVPISSNKLLVGSADSGCPTVEASTLNRAMAQNSHAFFVAGEHSKQLTELQPEIGRQNFLMTPDGVRISVNEVIADIERTNRDT